jgi:transcriptional regulator with XRE-family HTH domain
MKNAKAPRLGARLLETWRKEKGLSQEKIAEKLRVAQSTVSGYLSGRIVPDLDPAVRMERETDGAVPATSWAVSDTAKASTATVKTRKKKEKKTA